MRDFWLVHNIPDSVPIIDDPEVIKLQNKILKRNEDFHGQQGYVDPIILKF